ncbi:MAG: L,D-transpeptidase family protein [Lactobacillus helveticus]|uniref:L,D-transpeptidase family protein n=1 Tax=Lactobacillus helveticus TaxID=1587 RepID=UPI00197C9181|nr:L,D-transpeptidase family protein [Lactobacillus helveticus]MDN6022877.1 L,D-transpeptidase/peptidoglycan binding protein [Lactobacillus sp.]MBN6048901.1 L,D-transpeptidase [Lactobacillus helveticus]MCT0165135.1 murein L,D-transpeptidase [Lactobacillus helveticus]MCT0193349.1 murein L,D-transpeptidase [Lactobacillus helveticus]MCT0197576.1 murein L,D-transpeptidase [Lactobacillus helveticus]
MNEDLKRKNKRNNLIILIIGVLIVIGVVGGFGIHNHRVASQAAAEKYARTHFNPNVKIDGVKVGKLTVAKATAKVNKKAKNHVQLRNEKLVYSYNTTVPAIDEAETKAFFKKQQTKTPSDQAYNFTTKNLAVAKKKLNALKKAELTYKINGKNYQLKAKDLLNDVSYQDNKYRFGDTSKLTEKLTQIDKEVSTLHKSYKLTVPVGNKVKGKTITVENKTWGWGVYVKKARRLILQAFADGKTTFDGADAIYGVGYSTYAHGYGKSNHEIGNTYAVVSLKKQEVWLVRKGKLVAHLDDVVTGTMEGSKGDQTPRGVWYIHYKESPSTLRGTNDDGSSYASPVKYWMPFTLSGCGFHDASWRTDWSKKAYLRGGSHGCVNVKPSEIRKVWNNISKNEPVIIYE